MLTPNKFKNKQTRRKKKKTGPDRTVTGFCPNCLFPGRLQPSAPHPVLPLRVNYSTALTFVNLIGPENPKIHKFRRKLLRCND